MLTVPLTSAIGKYRLVAELGSGGMANVYLAVMLARNAFSKLVVLKVPRDHVTEDPDLLAMFVDEARLAARLSHPNVVQTYEVTEHGGRDVIVMEYLEGQALSAILAQSRKVGRPLPLSLHLRVIAEALQGLHYAHEATDYGGEPLLLVHRDVSPQNLFVTFDGQVKVLDFGVAKAATASHVTRDGTLKGKTRYMPPEQFIGSDVDRRADIYAVGVMLWEAATGQRLWKGCSEDDVVRTVLEGRVPSPRDANPDVHPDVDRIVRKALAFDRNARYPTCLDLQADLEAFMVAAALQASTKDVGAFVSDLFADMRSERRQIIDEQVRRAYAEHSGEYRVLRAGELPAGGPTSISGVTPLARSRRDASLGEPPAPDPVAEPTPATAEMPFRTRRPRAKVAVAIGVGAGVVLSILVVALVRRDAPPTPAPVASASAPPAPVAPPAPINVVLSANPADAAIFLDGERLATNPFTKRVARDGSAHTVRVEAKGHVPKSLEVQFDSDKELVVSLDRAVTFATGSPRALPPRTPASPPPTTAPAATTASTPTPATSPTTTNALETRPKRPERRIDDKL